MSSLKPRIEQLEERRLLSVTFGQNLVLNGGAEQYDGTADGYNLITPSHWSANGDSTVARYKRDLGPTIAISRPASGGDAFFSGGPDDESTDFFQTIDLSSIATNVDGGHVNFLLGALLGGFATSGDNAQVFVNFQDASRTLVSQRGTGSVSAGDRDYRTEMIGRVVTGTVPATARFAQVQIHFKRDSSVGYNDSFADNVSFQVVTNTPSTAGVTPALVSSSLPATVVGSQPVKGSIVLSIANNSSSVNQGVDTITLFASSDGLIDGNSIPLGTFRRKFSLNAGGTKVASFPLRNFNIPAGVYTILPQTIDRYLTVVNGTTGPVVTVVAPTVTLAASVTSVTPASLAAGRVINLVLLVTNTGNVKSSGLATIAVSLTSTTDPTPVLLATRYAKPVIKPGGAPIRLRLRVKIPAAQALGQYTPEVVFTQGANSAPAVAGVPFQVT